MIAGDTVLMYLSARFSVQPGLRRPMAESHQAVRDRARSRRSLHRGTATSVPHLHAEEFGRGHADHRDALAVEGELASQRARVAAQFALPEGVAHYRARRAASGAVVLGGEGAPDPGLHSQRSEEIAVDVLPSA